MDWFYFKIKITNELENQLLKENSDKHVLKYVILPNLTPKNELCHTAITNFWMKLN